ncbi:hypothetical protein MHYP_G00206500 [Metynnis hypsauchen]
MGYVSFAPAGNRSGCVAYSSRLSDCFDPPPTVTSRSDQSAGRRTEKLRSVQPVSAAKPSVQTKLLNATLSTTSPSAPVKISVVSKWDVFSWSVTAFGRT